MAIHRGPAPRRRAWASRAARSGALVSLCLLPLIGQAAALPVKPNIYVGDPAQSVLTFAFTQAGARSRGSFRQFSTTLSCRRAMVAQCTLVVTVPTTSLDTADKDRDQILRGAELFDVAKFPIARFSSMRIEPLNAAPNADGSQSVRVQGSLTIRDRTRPLPVPLKLRFAIEGKTPVAYLTGEVTFNRLDFGVGQGEWASTEWVADAVTVNFRIRLVTAKAALAQR